METLCEFLLRTPPHPWSVTDEVGSFWAQRLAVSLPFSTSLGRAAALGFFADRLGYAFAAGYQEALTQLLAGTSVEVQPGQPMALCATESLGAHPRAIATQLGAVPPTGAAAKETYRLDGEKTFVTLGEQAQRLLIVASRGLDAQGRNRLQAVLIPTGRAGVTLLPGPATPFVPEIPHASLRLQGVLVTSDELLPGDGYERYLKPFRTIEDVHVHAALLGYLVQVGRRCGFPSSHQTEALALLCALAPIAAASPLSRPMHIALAGVLGATARFVESSEPLWSQVEPQVAERWGRDRRLLGVAGRARAQRTESAWQELGRSS